MAETIPNGYLFERGEFERVLLMRFFPERTDRESVVLLAFLAEHIFEFDQLRFGVRIGQGLAPNPDHLPGVQANTTHSTRKRIDLLAMKGPQPWIVEVKERVTPASLGQILTYRHHYREEFPNELEPELVVIGRYSDPDTIVALQANNVTVILYPPDDAAGNAGASGL